VNTGYALNPARDLGPRFFTFVAGFPTVFTRGNNLYGCHFWIPIIGPIVGAVLGSKESVLKFIEIRKLKGARI
jgi:glycerol uptake facilitator-like aquaporin